MIKNYIKRFVYYVMLLIITCILFTIVSYEKLNKESELNSFNVNNNCISLKNNLHIDEKIYMSFEDTQSFLGNDVYVDRISRKIIVTSKDSISKYELNTAKKQINFEVQDTGKAIYIKQDGKDYLLLEEIANMYNYQLIFNTKLNTLDLVRKDKVQATINCNRVYGYLDKYNKNTRIILEDRNIEITKNEEFVDKNCIYYTAIIQQDGIEQVIYVLKKDITITDSVDNQTDVLDSKFYTLFFNEDTQNIDNVTNAVILEGLRLTSKSGSVENNINVEKVKEAIENNKEVYISISNGYTSTNYDNNITTQMLQSDIARENTILAIKDAIGNENIHGIVINFRQLNSGCKEDFTQFIKEISAYLHSLNKKVLVYVPLNATFINLTDITPYLDYAILIQYGTKELTSKTSGTHSGINWIESNLDELKQNHIDMSKIIIEIPLYSIIWSEKNNKVVNAERINMRALEDYLEKNELIYSLDETSKQNYIEYVKGSLKYKIWLEDNYSVKQKIDLAKKFQLAGVSLYKKGYESQSLLTELGGN